MRIGVDVRSLMDGKRTGVEEYTLGVLRAMLACSTDDTFVLFANSRRPMQLPSFAPPAGGARVEVRAFSYPNKAFNASLKMLRWPMLDRLLGGVDVLFLPNVRLAPRSADCPLVVTFHDLSFIRHPAYFSAGRRLWHVLMEPRRLAESATAVLTVSEATARDVEDLFAVPGERIRVVHSGIHPRMRPVDRASCRAADVQARYGLPPDFLLFLGTLEPRKNLLGLLDAYAAFRRAGGRHRLVLAGLRGWVRAAFDARVASHPFASDVRLTGFVEDADKPALYSMADLFVYPSFYEGFGFPPLEALACGTPVVTSYNAAIPETAGAWATLVNPADTNELAAVLVERLRGPRRVPASISAAVRQRYEWDRAGRETLAVLRTVARRG